MPDDWLDKISKIDINFFYTILATFAEAYVKSQSDDITFTKIKGKASERVIPVLQFPQSMIDLLIKHNFIFSKSINRIIRYRSKLLGVKNIKLSSVFAIYAAPKPIDNIS